MELLIFLLATGFLLLIGTPIGISIGFGIMSLVVLFNTTDLTFLAQQMYSGFDSLPILAIPIFMLAGSLMETGGLSKRLVNVANNLIGDLTGGLGVVTVIACMFFGAISGSAPATVGAIGTILLPYLYKANYDKHYSAALIASAGGLGVIVPPSIPLIMYGCTTNTSIGDLFLAGIGPALVVGIALIIVNYFISRKHNWKGSGVKFSFSKLGIALWEAKWALFMPIMVLGGIYGGIFTPTEAATVAVVYSIVVGLFIYRELTVKDILKIFKDTAPFVGGMMLTFAPAAALGSVLSLIGIPQAVARLLQSISNNLYIILIIVNIFMIFVGMVMDCVPAIIVFAPILYSALVPMGIHPVHLGLIMVINLSIGFVTPPVAANMFVASSLTGFPIDKIVKRSWPFLFGLFISLLIVTFIPATSVGILSLF